MSQGVTKRVKVFGVGSSVISEALGFLDKDSFETVNIINHQSIISAMGPPLDSSTAVEPEGLSARELTTLRADRCSSMVDSIHEQSLGINLLACDLTDELDGIYINHLGQVLTASRSLMKAHNQQEIVEDFRYVRFGSDEHYTLWSRATDEFILFLSSLGLLEKTIVVLNNYALRTRQGTTFPLTPGGLDPKLINSVYKRYVEHLLAIPTLNSILPPEDIILSDDNHKWGPSPYHYTDEFYKRLSHEIRNKVTIE